MKTFSFVILTAAFFTGPVMAKTTATIDPKASNLTWEGKKVGGGHSGNLKAKSGTMEVDGVTLVGGTLVIDMTSIEATDGKPKDNASLTGHLKADDFFGVEKHPDATIRITSVKPNPASTNENEVTGDLTIKGITKPVTFPATLTATPDGHQVSGVVTVDRTNYDIKYKSGKFFPDLADKAIKDDFMVKFAVLAKAPSAAPAKTKKAKAKS